MDQEATEYQLGDVLHCNRDFITGERTVAKGCHYVVRRVCPLNFTEQGLLLPHLDVSYVNMENGMRANYVHQEVPSTVFSKTTMFIDLVDKSKSAEKLKYDSADWGLF